MIEEILHDLVLNFAQDLLMEDCIEEDTIPAVIQILHQAMARTLARHVTVLVRKINAHDR